MKEKRNDAQKEAIITAPTNVNRIAEDYERRLNYSERNLQIHNIPRHQNERKRSVTSAKYVTPVEEKQ